MHNSNDSQLIYIRFWAIKTSHNGVQLTYLCIHKSIEFWQQSAYFKCFWETMITNSKWSLILKFSFQRIFKFMSQLNKSQILLKYCPSKSKSTHPFSVSPFNFDGSVYLLTSAEHILICCKAINFHKNCLWKCTY